jgi:hypothetical protein
LAVEIRGVLVVVALLQQDRIKARRPSGATHRRLLVGYAEGADATGRLVDLAGQSEAGLVYGARHQLGPQVVDVAGRQTQGLDFAQLPVLGLRRDQCPEGREGRVDT